MADDDNNKPADPNVSTEVSVKPSSATLPEKIGSYRILEQIGEGGMGIVYLAEQTEPVQRRVALKVIKLGMDTKQVIARFEAERQALAMIDHPCVARVFDAGVSDDGRSYFVMEHVPGVPITEHCDRQRLSIDHRLNLFIQVCNAVQHAHQKGIIHRDLKPGNILVSAREGRAVPKVIDFGVAKALHHKLTEKTLYTEQGQLIGTPEYMSPEQAEMTAQDIDTRSDIYSLGVLLYELLSGELPFDPKTLRLAAFGEIQRIIREVEPSKPSTKLSTLGDQSTTSAEKRRLDPRSLLRELRGDLDWIVMKALEKDRDRRYETANGLAMDIQRHLDNEPVLASPPSMSYRMRKFVRRNRTGVAASVVVAASLVAGTVGTTWQSIRATDQRNRAQVAETKANTAREAEVSARAEAIRDRDRAFDAETKATRELMRANAVVELIDDLFSSADPHERKGLDYTVRQLLDDFEGTIGDQFEGQPLVEASIRHTVGNAYLGLGLPDEAEPHLQTALDLRTQQLGEHDPLAIWTRRSLVSVHHARGEYAEAERRIRVLLEQFSDVEDPDSVQRSLTDSLADMLRHQGRYDEAEPLFVKTLEIQKRVLGDEHPSTLDSMHNLAILYKEQGRYDEAESMLVKTLEIQKHVLGDEHPDTLGSMHNLAILYKEQGRYDEAETLYLQTLEIEKRVQGEEHPDTLKSMNNLAVLYTMLGRYDEAEPLQLKTLEIQKRVLGDEHPGTLDSMNNLAMLYAGQGRYDEAEPLYLETLEIQKRVLGDEHPGTLGSMNNLAIVYMDQGRYDEAEPLYLETLEIKKHVLGDEHKSTLGSITNLGVLYLSMKRFDDARAMFEMSLPIKRRVLGMGHPWTRFALEGLAQSYEGLDQSDVALPLWRELQEFQLAQAEDPDASAQVLNAAAWDLLTNKHAELRDPARALTLAQRAVNMVGGNDPAILDTLALAQHLTGDTAAAIETQRRAVELLPDDEGLAETLARYEAALQPDKTERESDADKDN